MYGPPNGSRRGIVSVRCKLEIAYSLADAILSLNFHIVLHHVTELLGVLDEPDNGHTRFLLR